MTTYTLTRAEAAQYDGTAKQKADVLASLTVKFADGPVTEVVHPDGRRVDTYGKRDKTSHKSANPTDSSDVYTLTPEEARRYDGPDQQSFLVELRARFEGYVGDGDPRAQATENPGNITANTGPLVVNSAGQVVASPKDKAPRVGVVTYVRHPKGVAIAEYARALAPSPKGPFNTGTAAPEQLFTSTIDPNTLPSRSRSVPNPQGPGPADVDTRTNAQRVADEKAAERLAARANP